MKPMTYSMDWKKKLSELLPHLIAAIILAAVFAGLFFLHIGERARETEKSLSIQLGMTRSRIESAFNAELGTAQRIAAIVARKPSVTSSELDTLTYAMLPPDTAITSVSAAPNAIVAWYYPRTKGQSLIGHDLLSNPERRRAVVDAIDKKTPIASGPSESLEGGFSVYARAAVFIPEKGSEKLWGVISTAVDFGKVLKKTGLKDDTGAVRFALSGPDAQNPSLKSVFWGRREILADNPVRVPVNLPGLVWELAAIPSAGWKKALPTDYLILLAGLIACAAIIIAGLFSREGNGSRTADDPDATILLESVSGEIRNALTPVAAFLGGIEPASSSANAPIVGHEAAAASADETVSGTAVISPVVASRHAFRMLRRLSSDLRETISLERFEAKPESIEFDIRSIVSELIDDFAGHVKAKKIGLQTSVEAIIPQSLFGDPARLRRILYNLVGESIAYTDKGEVALSVILEDMGNNGAVLRFIVRDTGSNLDPTNPGNIFEAFSSARGFPSRRFATTGLSMSLAGSLVHLLGGHLEYEPGSGQGLMVRFTLRFRLSKEEEPAPVPETSVTAESTESTAASPVAEPGPGAPPAEGEPRAAQPSLSAAQAIPAAEVPLRKKTLFGLGRRARAENFVAAKTGPGSSDSGLTRAANVPAGTAQGSSSSAGADKANPDATNFNPPDQGQTPARAPVIREETGASLQPAPGSECSDLPFKPRILLAEDGEVNREIIMRMLKSRAYTADIATDGRQALAACLRNEYDIVFMDCVMPVMDGYESSSRMRQLKGPGRPVIIGMTSSVMESERERCFASGMDDVISKPFTLDELVATIKKHSETD